MHEVELIKRIRERLRSGTDVDGPNAGATPNESTIRRVTMVALEVLGIRIAADGSLLMAVGESRAPTPDDLESRHVLVDETIKTLHEIQPFTVAELADRRAELKRRIAANEDWMSKNWHLGKEVRHGCESNIDKDKRELATLEKLKASDET